jgi:hypothetical protein
MSSLSPTPGPGPQGYWPVKAEGTYGPSPGEPSSQVGDSPSTDHPTPTEQRGGIKVERLSLINGHPQPNEPHNSTGYKCPHPGCTAQPFQTQYLLK